MFFAWGIPWTEERGRLWPMGPQIWIRLSRLSRGSALSRPQILLCSLGLIFSASKMLLWTSSPRGPDRTRCDGNQQDQQRCLSISFSVITAVCRRQKEQPPLGQSEALMCQATPWSHHEGGAASREHRSQRLKRVPWDC